MPHFGSLSRSLLICCCALLALVSPSRADDPVRDSKPLSVTLVYAGTLLRAAGTPPETRQTLVIEGSTIKAVHDGVRTPME